MAKVGTSPVIHFDSERLLEQAVAGLLSRTPSVSEVRSGTGPLEGGANLLFYIPGPFGDKILCACITKNTYISGRVDDMCGIYPLMHQAEQALRTPRQFGSGRTEHVQFVYIVTPFPITAEALSSISQHHPFSDGHIAFVEGPTLLRLFQTVWPFFLDYQDAAMTLYQSESKPIDPDGLIAELAGIAPGIADAPKYHEFMLSALNTIFHRQLRDPIKECQLNDGRQRVDIVFKNAADHGFFADLGTKYRVVSPYVFVECKNYASEPANNELNQLVSRLSDRRGTVRNADLPHAHGRGVEPLQGRPEGQARLYFHPRRRRCKGTISTPSAKGLPRHRRTA